MRFGSLASLLFVSFVACSSSSNNPVTRKADAAADTSSDPCGPSSRIALPSCTSALEGHYCSYEACECCTNGATCESGDWVNPTINIGNGSCPADGGHTLDSGKGLDAGHDADAAKIVDSGAFDAGNDGGHYTCGLAPPDAGPGMQQFGTCAGLAKCCSGGVPGSYYCYAGDGGCPEVP